MCVLDWITIEGFKSIKSTERLELGPINILIGSNGSGKSNFIEIFSFLNSICRGRLRSYVERAGGADRVLHFGSRTTSHIKIHVSFQNESRQYRVVLAADETDGLFPFEEMVYSQDRWHSSGFTEKFLNSRNGEAEIVTSKSEDIGDVGQCLASWRHYHFHDTSSVSPIKKTVDVDDNRYLRPDGSNLAAFLYLLREKHKGSYSMIRRTLRLVAPFFDDFHLRPQALNEDKIRLEWRHTGSDAYFDVSALSDGSLRFIALTTLFLQPKQYLPSVVFVDEPELGLHPYATGMLASLVKQASIGTQIVFATQSPMLLDYFQPEDVLVADRVKGATEFTRPDGQRLQKWLEDYSLGQLWEKNEIGGRPVAEL